MILLPCPLSEVDALCARYHAYQGASGVRVYSFGVYEGSDLVAAYAWQPPPFGSAKSVNPHAPWSVLSLSRMVAVPKAERALKHVSKPLLRQMKHLIDRTRWPSLVTYSDEGLGHNGYVYQCSGWTPTMREEVNQYEDAEGRRTSPYSNGKWSKKGLTFVGTAFIQRWEHHAVPVEDTVRYMTQHGWERVLIPGKFWKSGNPAYRVTQHAEVSMKKNKRSIENEVLAQYEKAGQTATRNLSQLEIAARLNIDPATVCSAVRNLCQSGLLEVVSDTRSRRNRRYQVVPQPV